MSAKLLCPQPAFPHLHTDTENKGGKANLGFVINDLLCVFHGVTEDERQDSAAVECPVTIARA